MQKGKIEALKSPEFRISHGSLERRDSRSSVKISLSAVLENCAVRSSGQVGARAGGPISGKVWKVVLRDFNMLIASFSIS